MAENNNQNKNNPRNNNSTLFKRLTRLFSGPIVDYNQPSVTRGSDRTIKKYQFTTSTGKEFQRKEYYNPFSGLQNKTLLSRDKQIRYTDFEQMEYVNDNITYTTHLSIHKHTSTEFDIVVIDEIHLLSEAQIGACVDLFSINDDILGLTGTLSRWTKRTLSEELGLQVVAEYPIEKAIEEGVIVDYQITVIKVPLDDVVKKQYKGKWKTEKQQFKALSYVINKMM